MKSVKSVGEKGREKKRRWERRKQMTIRRNLAQTHLYRTGLQVVRYKKTAGRQFEEFEGKLSYIPIAVT